MKTPECKKNTASFPQATAITTVGTTTPPAQETASQTNRYALPAIKVPAQPAPIIALSTEPRSQPSSQPP